LRAQRFLQRERAEHPIDQAAQRVRGILPVRRERGPPGSAGLIPTHSIGELERGRMPHRERRREVERLEPAGNRLRDLPPSGGGNDK
jgi:hypothetical protein